MKKKSSEYELFYRLEMGGELKPMGEKILVSEKVDYQKISEVIMNWWYYHCALETKRNWRNAPALAFVLKKQSKNLELETARLQKHGFSVPIAF
jgi:hypothetical protein